ncbi:MAG TPA: hypothetical protein VFR58_05935, partial [Flavisolibacter sp.]|nr:hypothetical protein [Flavisolibacter sp.]
VYGKITQIDFWRNLSTETAQMFFAYDPSGNRVGKQVVNDKIHYTWYVRDAQGNVMAVYKNFRSNPFGAPLDTLRLSEHHLYGSSRLGVIERNLAMTKCKSNFDKPTNTTFTKPYRTTKATRRFSALPSALALLATGRVEP